MIIPLLLSLLLTTSGFAQQEKKLPPEKMPAMQSSALEPESGADNAQTNDQAASPPATRFIPSEKIHADDAVSFPVDI
jgi:hypothetical protein